MMTKLIEMFQNPSGFDSASNYVGSIPDDKLLVLVTRNRDSDILTESNFECALERLGGESDNVQVIRFGHWACGWWEALCVVEGSNKEALAQKMHKDLDGYPVLDENDFSEREMEEANRVWKDCYNKKERLEYIREYRSQFDFHNFSDLMQNIKGEYFSGYASELVN